MCAVAMLETMSNVVPGFTTSMKTRPLIIAKLEEFVRNKLLILYSNRVLDEIRTFVWVHGKPQAMKGYNDDLVMSLAIACWIRDTALLANKRAEEYNRVCLDAMVVANTKISTKIPGQVGYNRGMDHDRETKKEQAIREQIEFSWLYKG